MTKSKSLAARQFRIMRRQFDSLA
ncbi:hypothetical protein CCACVL1_01732 [Corchorus capsularis]|uniref:Uncharacterized protein n=1 Tax=Corchorus capsularis TaxID=210143 RepID=A0A1R3KG21_COCAP|nr:hypothetical protein CCACVL1_01732 [Corchorus capsularis]